MSLKANYARSGGKVPDDGGLVSFFFWYTYRAYPWEEDNNAVCNRTGKPRNTNQEFNQRDLTLSGRAGLSQIEKRLPTPFGFSAFSLTPVLSVSVPVQDSAGD
jgi:hypothetical protein